GEPVVIIMCEYDALPEIGHACGHNLIAECGAPTGIAMKKALESDSSLSGKVVVLGTPGEEGGQGKFYLLRDGAFEGADVALMAHPFTKNISNPVTSALAKLLVTYDGKPAHAGGAPWDGINALDAAVGAYVNVSMLRQQMKTDYRATGIVKEGGTAANVIPEHTEMEFTFRAKDTKNLLVLKEKLESCFKAAATATGCSVELKDEGPVVENLISNKPMSKVFEAFARAVGNPMVWTISKIYSRKHNDLHAKTPYFRRLRACKAYVTFSIFLFSGFPSESGLDENTGSTDAGNVSHVVPTLHPMFALKSTGINHTAEFAKATNTPDSFGLTLKTAKALALTALEVMRDPEFLKEIKKQFESDTADDMVKARSRL
ncbi:aminobenzoyl-glutamate utilization protein B, putative, partial [Ixodes scapularis]